MPVAASEVNQSGDKNKVDQKLQRSKSPHSILVAHPERVGDGDDVREGDECIEGDSVLSQNEGEKDQKTADGDEPSAEHTHHGGPRNQSLFFIFFHRPVYFFIYMTNSDILKMGRNIHNTIPPIITPMTTINNGSNMEVSPSSIVLTSSW